MTLPARLRGLIYPPHFTDRAHRRRDPVERTQGGQRRAHGSLHADRAGLPREKQSSVGDATSLTTEGRGVSTVPHSSGCDKPRTNAEPKAIFRVLISSHNIQFAEQDCNVAHHWAQVRRHADCLSPNHVRGLSQTAPF